MKLITIALSAVLINNFVVVRFLGICPFLGVSKKLDTAIGMGAAVTFVMTLAAAVCHMVYGYILTPFGIQYLYTITFILVIAALVQAVETFMKKSSPTLYRALGIYLPLITTNCAVLGVCIINMDENYSLIESVSNSFFAAIGFTLLLVLFAGIRENMEYNEIPEHFKGFPIALIGAGLMSLAFSGFSGLIK